MKSSRKGVSSIAAGILFLLVIIVIGIYVISNIPKPQPQPSILSFSLNFPKSVIAGETTTASVNVVNKGTDATGVSVVVVSDAVSASSNPVDIRGGSTADIPLKLTGKDVQDGPYAVVVYLQYSDQSGTNKTNSKGVSIYLLPSVNLVDVRYQQDLLHLLGKNTIGTTDSTTLLFKVQGGSSAVIYGGMFATVKSMIEVPGLSIDPASIQIGPVGPHGKTGDYAFKIESNGVAPGTYRLQISLFSKDNQLITDQTMEITVTG